MIKETSLAELNGLEGTQVLVGIPLRICLLCGRVQRQVIVGGKLDWKKIAGNEIYKEISRGLSNKMVEMQRHVEEDTEKHLLPVSEIPKVEAPPKEAFSELIKELKKYMDEHDKKEKVMDLE